jgi:hypothetical protein
MELPKKLLDDIREYCRLNQIADIDGFITKMVRTGFTIEKYGYSPDASKPQQVVEKEVIKEVIREVEVVKEVPVEKIVEISNNEELNKYLEEIRGLKEENEKLKGGSEFHTKVDRPPVNDLYGE